MDLCPNSKGLRNLDLVINKDSSCALLSFHEMTQNEAREIVLQVPPDSLTSQAPSLHGKTETMKVKLGPS